MKKYDTKKRKETLKDTEPTAKKLQDEKNKTSVHSVSTPRHLVSKTAVDIYGQKNKTSAHTPNAPKKLLNASQKSSNLSPMRDFLKSSPSSTSQSIRKDIKERKEEAKVTLHSARQTPRSTRNIPFSSVTVNSPINKRKLNLNDVSSKESENARTNLNKHVMKTIERSKEVDRSNKEVFSTRDINKVKTLQGGSSKEVVERERSKTRTLNENEVKVLSADMIDNNAEMLNLSRKLTAKPKVFYIDLEEGKHKSDSKPGLEKTSDEDVSYEDDFESYESDFDSYHSEEEDDNLGEGDDDPGNDKTDSNDLVQSDEVIDQEAKEIRDEERMLDSGSYDLRDRSAKSKPTAMENILEDAEDSNDKKVSLTDEGFQEMSSSSAVSSIRTVNVDLLDRPLFIDFAKSKQNKRRKLIFERLQQRANDLLNMISLHEMSYSLFEMKPVSYDIYMATFGRNNYIQAGVQTNEDNVPEETQTDEIICHHKWTQYPVEFSKHSTYLYKDVYLRKYSNATVDYISKLDYLLNKNDKVISQGQIDSDEEYITNPLRIYLEQKDGVGVSEMLPYEKYKTKLKTKDYNSDRLKRVLKKFETRISSILNFNSGNTLFTNFVKSTKVPFSKGYVTIPYNKCTDNFKFLNHSKITQAFFSQSVSNLIMTVHRLNAIEKKCLVCLWDISVASQEPLKMLVAIDDIIIGRFSGNRDGILVAALEDSTIHLWDLSEEATWHNSVANEKDSTNMVEISNTNLTEFEMDREWNLKNSRVQNDKFNVTCALHACSYTSSANIMICGDHVDRIVGLELTLQNTISQEGGRKIVVQVISLQRIGILTTWSVVQERSKNPSKDLGKAYWSKMILEKSQSIDLSNYIDLPVNDNEACDSFNLAAARKRVSNLKKEKRELKRTLSRPKSAMSSEFESDRPSSVASVTSAKGAKLLQAQKNIEAWGDSFICNNLKVIRVDDCENILVAKDRGEVLCCRKILGTVKVYKFSVAADVSSITDLEVSRHGLPYFLAATDSGTVHLCSILENRVLLTLDCRNVPPTTEVTEKCKSDHKGRFMGSVLNSTSNINETELLSVKMSVKNVIWSPVNPCCIYAVLRDGTLLAWDLTNSDIYGQCSGQNATAVIAGHSALVLLTPEGEVQIHRFNEEQRTKENLDLFKKYVALL